VFREIISLIVVIPLQMVTFKYALSNDMCISYVHFIKDEVENL
jgi:hypothetical protein